jgi:hypothetical protein
VTLEVEVEAMLVEDLVSTKRVVPDFCLKKMLVSQPGPEAFLPVVSVVQMGQL